jgi:hypothetical protein
MKDFDQMYDDMIDECYGEFKIGVCTFSASRILRELDPIAYECGYYDWFDSEGFTEEGEEE